MDGCIRPYVAKKDRTSVHRIWKECGWPVDEEAAVDTLLRSGFSMVFELKGAAESFVTSVPARLHYAGTQLDHAAIAAVATGRVARNLGTASGTVAAILSEEAARGCSTAGLGVFEQGFYDRLGFGTGTYEHWIAFDPAWLIDLPVSKAPQRFDVKDFRGIHKARLARRKTHGAIDILAPELLKVDMMTRKNTFGLGYKKGNEITHCVVMHCSEIAHGPYSVVCLAYRTLQQFRELLGIIRGLSDQVRQVRLREPGEIQMQDFLKKPFQLQAISSKGSFESLIKAVAYWQIRILDLKKCISVMKCIDRLEFNLIVEDPVTGFLPAKSVWKGCGGEYTVNLGSGSSVRKGLAPGLDTLNAAIGDFSRYWLGVQAAEVLNVTGRFDGPQRLLRKLDSIRSLPAPAPDWDY
ncbi:MAG: hypothetical protein JW852_08490 [Spirochaetales bacterium]|nr:hypothetical protein [Spirochaetales bacterium]